MLLLRESLAIFRRNPLITTTVIFLIAAASMGQVFSLGALYPILQVVASDEASNTPSSNGAVFVQLLSKIGAAPTLTNFLLLFVVLGIGYSILNWFADTFQGIHLRNFESSIRQELLETAVYADWLYLKKSRWKINRVLTVCGALLYSSPAKGFAVENFSSAF